ncbi:MAG: galactose mutarotase [Oscillospiraceae bacterium]|nr:galactose mutarotase [Oscillospiraceae bacterium]
MVQSFGCLSDGRQAQLYKIENNILTAYVTDYGATLVQLWVPDKMGNKADIVLGYDRVSGYERDTNAMGGTVGRNANRIAGARFTLNGTEYRLVPNDGENSLHSLPDGYHKRLWQVSHHDKTSVTFTLFSPHLDQGFPGNCHICVTYALQGDSLTVTYEGLSDRDTVFNLTNHSFFNLAGHDKQEAAMTQELILSARVFVPADAASIPLGQERSVDGTPMDFRFPKVIGAHIDDSYQCLQLQGGFDHTYEVFTAPCAILRDPHSGRTMALETDCPGLHFYAGNYLSGEQGKGGAVYPRRSGICLEPHFYPDALHNPQWKQPVIRAGVPYRCQTKYRFD